MNITAIRSQMIWSPLVGWVLLSIAASAQAQTAGQTSPAPVPSPSSDNTGTTSPDQTVPPGGAAPPIILPGSLPSYTNIPGTGTGGGSNLGSSSAAKPLPSPTAIDNPLLTATAPTQYSSTGQILYGAPVGIQTFSGAGVEGDELGITVGSFTLYPTIDLATGVDSNVFAQNSATGSTTASPYLTAVPALEFKSQWLRHQVHGLLKGGFAWYTNAPTQNYQNYTALLDGKLEIQEDFYITPSISYVRATEAIGTPNTAFATAPTVVDSFPVKLGIYQRFNRFFYDINGTATRYWYTDYSVISSSGLPAASRDRWEYGENFRFGYEITDDVALYVQPTIGQIRYILPVNSADQQRDSDAYSLGLGATWILSATSQFDGSLGYTTRTYPSGMGNNSATTGQLSGSWNGYAPLTLQPNFSRSIQESALSQYKNIVSTTLGLNFNYVIHDAWSATGGLSYTSADYIAVPGAGASPRTDTIVRASLGLNYSLRPQVSIGPNIEYTQGSSTDPVNGPFYNRYLFSVRLSAKR